MKDRLSYDFSIKELKKFAKAKKTHEWVHSFLLTLGKNKEMAVGLQRRREKGYISWIGPLHFPLQELTRCCGPEKTIEFSETAKKWEKRVESILKKISGGWEVPVLIANPRPWPILSIRDGNHRYEALVRNNKKKYPTLFWFDNSKDRQKFLRKYRKYKDIL